MDPTGLPLPSPLTQLAELMAGEFNNHVQAQADPTWYVPLTVWQRPIALFEDSVTLFLEQANLKLNQAPYRQRVLRLQSTPEGWIRGQYYALMDPQRYRGGGQRPEQLRSLDSTALERLPHCWVQICWPAVPDQTLRHQFIARPEERCSFVYQGQRICVELGFDIHQTANAVHLLSYEKGIDERTDRAVWGALMGPFDLIKQRSFALSRPYESPL